MTGPRGLAVALALPALLLVSCRGEPGGARAGSSARPAADPSAAAASQTGAFGGWPTQLHDLVLEARERFEVPGLLPEPGQALPSEILLVDVRTPAEVAVSRIPGALLLSDEAQREAFLAEAHTGQVVVYCTAGWRSAEFTAQLLSAGVEARNLEGGICAWALAGGKPVDGQGRPTRRIHAFSNAFAECVPEGFVAVFD